MPITFPPPSLEESHLQAEEQPLHVAFDRVVLADFPQTFIVETQGYTIVEGVAGADAVLEHELGGARAGIRVRGQRVSAGRRVARAGGRVHAAGPGENRNAVVERVDG